MHYQYEVGIMLQQMLQEPWIVMLIFIVTIVIASKIISVIFIKILERISKLTKTEADDIFLHQAKKSFPYLLMLLIVYLVDGKLYPVELSANVKSIVATLIVLLVARVAILSINLLLDIWGSNFAKKVRSAIDEELLRLAHGVIRILFYALALVYILNIWNIDVVPILGSLGIAGIAVALAVKEPLANIFGGVQLLLDKNLGKGDIVELSTGQSGMIHGISLRSTRLKTWAGKLVIIPNSTMANATITNISKPDKRRRVKVPFTVAYGTDPDYVKEIITEEINSIDVIEKEDPAPMVLFTNMGDNALEFEAKYWVNDLGDFLVASQEGITKVYERLNREGIEIPFPQRTVWNIDSGKNKTVKYKKKQYKPKKAVSKKK